jgi:hypothetical protein
LFSWSDLLYIFSSELCLNAVNVYQQMARATQYCTLTILAVRDETFGVSLSVEKQRRTVLTQ